VRETGFDEPAFRDALASEETIELIRADASAADAAGLKFTPMIFINGRPIDVGR